MFVFGRFIRNTKALITYPFWLFSKSAPDNHIFKKKRVHSIATRFSCETFIETGTFYGQMTNAVKAHFKKVLSVELFEPLYLLNKASFASCPDIRIYWGDSSNELEKMLEDASGRILFWLDGHYSGDGTACGNQVSPILVELDIILKHSRNDHCLLIDDARLFTGTGGYPTLEETKEKLLAINPNYIIEIDHDCIVAVPGKA
jgi:hypothetical protein